MYLAQSPFGGGVVVVVFQLKFIIQVKSNQNSILLTIYEASSHNFVTVRIDCRKFFVA